MLVLILVAGVAQAGEHRGVSISSCDLTVTLPNGWVAEKTNWGFGGKSDCTIGLRPQGWLKAREQSEEDIADYAIYIGSMRGDVFDLAEDQGFVYEGTQWYVLGRASHRTPAKANETRFWTKIRGESEVGSYRKGGGYLGTGEAFVALLFRGDRILTIIADRSFASATTFDEIVDSIRAN